MIDDTCARALLARLQRAFLERADDHFVGRSAENVIVELGRNQDENQDDELSHSVLPVREGRVADSCDELPSPI